MAPKGGIVQDGRLRYYGYTDFVLLVATPDAAFKIARITFGRDGSVYVQFPYCVEKEGWIGVLPIPPGREGPTTYTLSEHGSFVPTDVKFAHHTSGVVHFTKTGDDRVPRTGRHSWPLTGPIGQLFSLQVLEPERFEPLKKADKKAMHLAVRMPRAAATLGWYAEWRRKKDFEQQIHPPGGVAGPVTRVQSRATGEVNEVFFLGQPEGFGAQDHIIVLTAGTPKAPDGFSGPGMAFLGGWDMHEVREVGEKPDLKGCLAFIYPAHPPRATPTPPAE